MDVVKQWTLNICLTLIGAVILSLVSPRGSMGRFYKTVLSLLSSPGFCCPSPAARRQIFPLISPMSQRRRQTQTACMKAKSRAVLNRL